MKVDICCIARREEMTIIDWVEHHRRIGINHIYICDNNDVGDNSLVNILRIYIDIGYVTVFTNTRGQKAIQMDCYNSLIKKCVTEKLNDWMVFIDCDEYISFTESGTTISDFLRDIEKKCPDIGVLYVNWDCYGANKQIFYEPKPVIERFTKRIPKDSDENKHIKSFVKSTCHAFFPGCPHNARPIDGKLIYNTLGKELVCSPFQEIRNDYPVYIKHFVTKSIQEYIYRKYKSGTADSETNTPYDFEYFIKFNKGKIFYEKPFNNMIELLNYGQH